MDITEIACFVVKIILYIHIYTKLGKYQYGIWFIKNAFKVYKNLVNGLQGYTQETWLSFPGTGIPMLNIRWPQDCIIFNMGILILVRRHLYTETASRTSKTVRPTNIVNRFRYINNNFTKDRYSIPIDMTIVPGLHKFSLQATIDHYELSMYSGHYTTSINYHFT